MATSAWSSWCWRVMVRAAFRYDDCSPPGSGQFTRIHGTQDFKGQLRDASLGHCWWGPDGCVASTPQAGGKSVVLNVSNRRTPCASSKAAKRASYVCLPAT